MTLRYFKTQGQGTYSRINSQEKILLCYILYRGCFGEIYIKYYIVCPNLWIKTVLYDLISKRSAHKPLLCHDKG